MSRVMTMCVVAGLSVLAASAAIAQEAEEAPGLEMQKVDSTAIKAIGYDEVAQVLTVEFTSGETYDYVGVPKDVFEAFSAAESKGEFFQANIKGKFEFTKK